MPRMASGSVQSAAPKIAPPSARKSNCIDGGAATWESDGAGARVAAVSATQGARRRKVGRKPVHRPRAGRREGSTAPAVGQNGRSGHKKKGTCAAGPLRGTRARPGTPGRGAALTVRRGAAKNRRGAGFRARGRRLREACGAGSLAPTGRSVCKEFALVRGDQDGAGAGAGVLDIFQGPPCPNVPRKPVDRPDIGAGGVK